MRSYAFLIAVALAGAPAVGVGAASDEMKASEALAIAEKICLLPKGAEANVWVVSPANDPRLPPIPGPPIPRTGRYWLVTANYNLPGYSRAFTGISILKSGGSTPQHCETVQIPNFVISPPSKK